MNIAKLLSVKIPSDTAVGISGFILGLAIACLLAHLPGSSSEWASWVQAFGSIGAILGALWVSERQAKSAITSIKLQAEQAARDKRNAAIAIVDAAMDRAKEIESTMSIRDLTTVQIELYKTYDRSIIDGLVRALQGVPLHEIGSSKGVSQLLLFTDQLPFLAIAIQRFLEGPMKDSVTGPHIRDFLDGPPDEVEIGRTMLASSRERLRLNTHVHLRAIRQHYNAFSAEMSAS
ncbi:hypothetical protein [Burkholderia mayonis]|uniref:Uncharacterized protein n=1 Tax=Burkholderia mayonis TaxID=1385591 RepID=A0A1B4FVA7_9BURK|nr:hypothetical protein [Burkholderia mayonis]AOJ07620.1 hypothetical protein WS71_10065 [Burkholderia mayonis]KVE58331.1 hypothetical protein WS71_24590 [Burkholderia mayonis]